MIYKRVASLRCSLLAVRWLSRRGDEPCLKRRRFLARYAVESLSRARCPKMNIKVGVALGGGGARGLAHIGVLKAFEEGDVPIGAITGTSVGALIGSLYAAGITTAQMEQMTQEIGWSSLTNYSRYSPLFRLVFTEQKACPPKIWKCICGSRLAIRALTN